MQYLLDHPASLSLGDGSLPLFTGHFSQVKLLRHNLYKSL